MLRKSVGQAVSQRLQPTQSSVLGDEAIALGDRCRVNEHKRKVSSLARFEIDSGETSSFVDHENSDEVTRNGYACAAFHRPVLPKPPAPRLVSARSSRHSTGTSSTAGVGAMTS